MYIIQDIIFTVIYNLLLWKFDKEKDKMLNIPSYIEDIAYRLVKSIELLRMCNI